MDEKKEILKEMRKLILPTFFTALATAVFELIVGYRSWRWRSATETVKEHKCWEKYLEANKRYHKYLSRYSSLHDLDYKLNNKFRSLQ